MFSECECCSQGATLRVLRSEYYAEYYAEWYSEYYAECYSEYSTTQTDFSDRETKMTPRNAEKTQETPRNAEKTHDIPNMQMTQRYTDIVERGVTPKETHRDAERRRET